MANSTLLLLSLFKGSYEYCNYESVIIINTQWNDLNSFYESDFMYVLHKIAFLILNQICTNTCHVCEPFQNIFPFNISYSIEKRREYLSCKY